MIKKINSPSVIKAAGNKHKIIEEFVGRVNTKSKDLSVARMKSPAGWIEPGQIPEFDEYTLVLRGELRVKTRKEEIIVNEGEAVAVTKREWVQYSTPLLNGAEYISVCIPAFSPDAVHRDKQELQ